MKTIIAGSRQAIDYSIIIKAVELSEFDITEVVSGTARGVDKLGERFARDNGIPLRLFPANWSKYGKSAGMIRNEEMAKYSDALIAIWDGQSRGTAGMIRLAKRFNLEVFINGYK